MPQVAVIGGGLSGLSVAYGLQKKGLAVQLFEAQERLGGALWSVRDSGFLIEQGAHSFVEDAPDILPLLEELGIAQDLVQAPPLARKRFVLHQGHLHPLPLSPGAFLSSQLFSWPEKARLLMEWTRPKGDPETETAAQFARRRLGEGFFQKAFSPFVSGVYAGDPEALSLPDAFPRLAAAETRYGSLLKAFWQQRKAHRPRILSFKEGMETLPKALSRSLPAEAIHLNTRLLALDLQRRSLTLQGPEGATEAQFDGIVLTLPAHALSALQVSPQKGFAFSNQVHYPPLTVAYLGYERTQVAHPLDGFGFLAAHSEPCGLLGALFPTSVFADRAPPGCVSFTCFIGGARYPSRAHSPSALEQAHQALAPILGIKGPPKFQRLHRWGSQHPIAHFHLGHAKSVLAPVAALEARFPGIFLTSPYLHPPSVTQCLRQGLQTAQKVADGLAAPLLDYA